MDRATAILYDDFNGIIAYETAYPTGTYVSKDHSSLKQLIPEIKELQPGWICFDTIVLVTKCTPANFAPFVSWFKDNLEIISETVENIYIFYELNQQYDYHNDYRQDLLDTDEISNLLREIKHNIYCQRYSGEWPPHNFINIFEKYVLPIENAPAWLVKGFNFDKYKKEELPSYLKRWY